MPSDGLTAVTRRLDELFANRTLAVKPRCNAAELDSGWFELKRRAEVLRHGETWGAP